MVIVYQIVLHNIMLKHQLVVFPVIQHAYNAMELRVRNVSAVFQGCIYIINSADTFVLNSLIRMERVVSVNPVTEIVTFVLDLQ